MLVFDNKPVFNKSVLSNGVTVVTEHHRYTRATCASIFVKLGTCHEPEELTGLAHFIEHVVFKGTKNRSALDIAKALEAVGGEINAYTTKEYTCFHTTSLREHLNLSIDVLTDVINNALIQPNEVDKEREVVLQEIDMTADQLEEYIFDLCFEEAYKNQPLGRSILGTPDSLSRMTASNVKKYYNEEYRGSNVIVAVAGDVDHEEVVKLCQKSLGRKKLEKKRKTSKATPKAKPFKVFKERPSEQVHLLVNFPSAGYQTKERFDAYMCNAVLGGGMTSRLYQKIREDKGWVYSVYSYLNSFINSGTLSLYAGTTEEFALRVMKEFKKECDKIVDKGITKKELDYFKQQVKGQILLGADDIENRMNSIGVNEMVFGEYRPVEYVIGEIDAVTPKGVQKYLEKTMDWNSAGLLMLGNSKQQTVDKIFNL